MTKQPCLQGRNKIVISVTAIRSRQHLLGSLTGRTMFFQLRGVDLAKGVKHV